MNFSKIASFENLFVSLYFINRMFVWLKKYVVETSTQHSFSVRYDIVHKQCLGIQT